MKQSAIDKAIEALEAKKNEQDRVIEMAIQELIVLKDSGKITPTNGEPKARKPRKKRGMPAAEAGL